MTNDLVLRFAKAFLVLALALVLVAGLAILAAGDFAGWHFALAAYPKLAVAAAAVTGAAGAVLAVAVWIVPQKAGTGPASTTAGIWSALFVVLAAVWLIFVGCVAANDWRPEVIPMSLSIVLLGAALGVARHTGGLLANAENKLEVRHDIVGIGGGLGAWRISQSAASAVLTLLLLAGALSLATSGLRPARVAGGAAEAPPGAKSPEAPVKPGAKD